MLFKMMINLLRCQIKTVTLLGIVLAVIISIAFRVYFDDTASSRQDSDFSDDAFSGLRRYCNFLENIKIEDEKIIFDNLGFKLEKVIVLFRHGDRGPLRFVKELEKLNCDKSNSTYDNTERLYTNLVEELLRSQTLLKQLNLPDEYTDLPGEECQLERLTKMGLTQHAKLGYLLSSTYSTRLGLTTVNWLESLKVTTTRYSRTFQSALALVHGISRQLNGTAAISRIVNMPEFQFAYDPFFCGYNESSEFCLPKCATIDILNSKHLSKANQANKNLVYHIARIIALNANDFTSLVSVLDGLSTFVCHREKIPCDAKYGCVAASQVQDLNAKLCLQMSAFLQSSSYQHSAWLKLYGFLNDLIHQIRFGTNKLLLYSGHDITIEPLKTIFALTDCTIPPYASRLLFEVHSKSSEQYLRVIYNGIDVTKHLPMDKYRPDLNVPLSLVKVTTFSRFIQEQFVLHTGTNDYNTACSQHDSTTPVHLNEADQSRV